MGVLGEIEEGHPMLQVPKEKGWEGHSLREPQKKERGTPKRQAFNETAPPEPLKIILAHAGVQG